MGRVPDGAVFVMDKISRKYDLSTPRGASRLKSYQLRCCLCGKKASMFCSLCSEPAVGSFFACCSARTKRGCFLGEASAGQVGGRGNRVSSTSSSSSAMVGKTVAADNDDDDGHYEVDQEHANRPGSICI